MSLLLYTLSYLIKLIKHTHQHMLAQSITSQYGRGLVNKDIKKMTVTRMRPMIPTILMRLCFLAISVAMV